MSIGDVYLLYYLLDIYMHTLSFLVYCVFPIVFLFVFKSSNICCASQEGAT